MLKHAKWLVIPATFIILMGCGGGNESGKDKDLTEEESRFGEEYTVYMITDSETGCKYIKSGGYSSWAYLHGSCPDVIAKETGVKPYTE
jgi:hypothetical protein